MPQVELIFEPKLDRINRCARIAKKPMAFSKKDLFFVFWILPPVYPRLKAFPHYSFA